VLVAVDMATASCTTTHNSIHSHTGHTPWTWHSTLSRPLVTPQAPHRRSSAPHNRASPRAARERVPRSTHDEEVDGRARLRIVPAAHRETASQVMGWRWCWLAYAPASPKCRPHTLLPFPSFSTSNCSHSISLRNTSCCRRKLPYLSWLGASEPVHANSILP